MLKGRLFTPIEAIVKVLFKGDTKSATKAISVLIERQMLEYSANNRVTITAAGKMSIRKQEAHCRAMTIKV